MRHARSLTDVSPRTRARASLKVGGRAADEHLVDRPARTTDAIAGAAS
jgi:hypothetical protein